MKKAKTNYRNDKFIPILKDSCTLDSCIQLQQGLNWELDLSLSLLVFHFWRPSLYYIFSLLLGVFFKQRPVKHYFSSDKNPIRGGLIHKSLSSCAFLLILIVGCVQFFCHMYDVSVSWIIWRIRMSEEMG